MKKLNGKFVALILLCVALIYSCDNSLDPLDTDTGIFSIYGFLDLNEQTNHIRVRNLNAPFTKKATENLDASVLLQNLNQGTETILESYLVEHEGVFLHNFVYNNQVIPDNEYRLTVERSDGAAVDMTITTPTMPEPVAEPLNQNCYIPIEFSMEPINGGTVVVRFGLGPDEDDDPWGATQILRPNENQNPGKIAYTFTPHDLVISILPGNDPNRRCGQYLYTGNIYVSYIHYGPGFFEQITNDTFDVMNTQRFGAVYYDTLAVPVDTSPVCPPDC